MITRTFMLRSFALGLLSAAITYVVTDWSKPRIAIMMAAIGAVALCVIVGLEVMPAVRGVALRRGDRRAQRSE